MAYRPWFALLAAIRIFSNAVSSDSSSGSDTSKRSYTLEKEAVVLAVVAVWWRGLSSLSAVRPFAIAARGYSRTWHLTIVTRARGAASPASVASDVIATTCDLARAPKFTWWNDAAPSSILALLMLSTLAHLSLALAPPAHNYSSFAPSLPLRCSDHKPSPAAREVHVDPSLLV